MSRATGVSRRMLVLDRLADVRAFAVRQRRAKGVPVMHEGCPFRYNRHPNTRVVAYGCALIAKCDHCRTHRCNLPVKIGLMSETTAVYTVLP